ncbi:MAG: hypothetical protein WGP56_24665, partial [Escherichia coli]
ARLRRQGERYFTDGLRDMGSCRDKGKLGHSLCNLMMLLGFKYFSVLPFLVPSLAVYAEAFAFP